MRRFGSSWLAGRAGFAIAAVCAALGVAPSPALAELKPGDTLDAKTWEQAKGMMSDEILEKYKTGQYVSPIGDFKPGVVYALDPSFVEATKKNAGKYKIDENGSVVDAATGKLPDNAFGAPFPDLDPKDPQIALKVLWNYEYAYWSNGSNRINSLLMWLNPSSKSPERAVSLQSVAKIYEGTRFPDENPNQFSRLDRNLLLSPSDVYGTASLGWRYKDAGKRDSQWAYVPALRRVRAVSPSNRSDGVFGSEMTQDDGFNGFDGKPEDFTYKMIGMRDEYMPFSPEALEGKVVLMPNPSGQGWDVTTPESRYGFRQENWAGAPWFPLDNTLVKRPVWVIEATPKDPYYLYGKVIFTVDRETYKVANVVKYDWKGVPTQIFIRGISFGQAGDGYRYVNLIGGGKGGAFAESLRNNRATAADPNVPGTKSEHDLKLKFNEFEQETLSRLGK